jgi:hypothetical protein
MPRRMTATAVRKLSGMFERKGIRSVKPWNQPMKPISTVVASRRNPVR